MILEFLSSIPTWLYFVICVVSIAFGAIALDWKSDLWHWFGWIPAAITGIFFIIRVAGSVWNGISYAWLGVWGWIERNGWLVFGIAALIAVVKITGHICDAVKSRKNSHGE